MRGPLDCPGVKGMPFTRLFISHRGEPAYCARCGLLEADYRQVAAVAGAEQDNAASSARCTHISPPTKEDGE
jgi:hypothetical protein